MSRLQPPATYHRYDDLPAMVPMLPGRWMVGALIATFAAVLMLLHATKLSVELTAVSLAYAGIAIAAATICYRLRDRATRARRLARDLTEGVAMFACVSLLCALASYPIAAASHGFADPTLQRIDIALHFDWLGWYAVVAAHPLLQQAERAAYLSIFVTPAILLFFFAWEGRRAEARLFIATFWLAAAITLALFAFMPAEGPLAYLAHGRAPYMPFSALYQQQDIPALRLHILRGVDLGSLHGLVCAPSFHAASGVIFAATGWRVRPLRWPVVALNGAMLLATPVEGTHYLSDMLAGAAVAIVALTATPLLVRAALARFGHGVEAPFAQFVPAE